MVERYNIDLVTVGKRTTDWRLGRNVVIEEIKNFQPSMIQQLLSEPEGFVLFLHEDLSVNESLLSSVVQRNQSVGVWYDDRISPGVKVHRILEFISPGIYFNLRTSPEGFSIWNMSLNCLLVKKEVLASAGFLDPRFESIEGALAEWIHRIIYHGVLIQRASLLVETPRIAEKSIPIEDEWRFIKYRFGRQWLRWSVVRYMLNGFGSPGMALAGYQKIGHEQLAGNFSKTDHNTWSHRMLKEPVPRISIIIPTIERYPYLITVLTQLKEQTILPIEVMVIDQTPPAFRKPELFTGYEQIGLRYFSMEKSGQCGSRNLGLLECTGDYILFIDDDVEIKPDLLENHIKCLLYFDAEVSCGVCDEVGAGPIPKDYSFIRHADVFPTNNGMVKRSALERSGLFDMAFDHGQRADGDLGARLYKSGAVMILNPEIRVLHHRAPRGGLRKHNVRKITYSSSRKYITHFRIPHITELYLNKIHFSRREQREYIVLTLLGMFSIRGAFGRKILKVGFALIMLPFIILKIYKRNKVAFDMLKVFPKIPQLRKKYFSAVEREDQYSPDNGKLI